MCVRVVSTMKSLNCGNVMIHCGNELFFYVVAGSPQPAERFKKCFQTLLFACWCFQWRHGRRDNDAIDDCLVSAFFIVASFFSVPCVRLLRSPFRSCCVFIGNVSRTKPHRSFSFIVSKRNGNILQLNAVCQRQEKLFFLKGMDGWPTQTENIHLRTLTCVCVCVRIYTSELDHFWFDRCIYIGWSCVCDVMRDAMCCDVNVIKIKPKTCNPPQSV